ncbi:Immunoglobulin Superfamily Member 8 [Manis pentadactyla]|nr:Immunoglobulin Superfamily Member 8 [Manis pentadactyla]
MEMPRAPGTACGLSEPFVSERSDRKTQPVYGMWCPPGTTSRQILSFPPRVQVNKGQLQLPLDCDIDTEKLWPELRNLISMHSGMPKGNTLK